MAYLGPPGTFCEQAAVALDPAGQVTLIPAPSITAAVAMVRADRAGSALVPLTNSVAGPVVETARAMRQGRSLSITDQIDLPVTFGLYGRPGQPVATIATCASHPHASAQCLGWIQQNLPRAVIVPAASTAAAAALAATGTVEAAICSPFAGAGYGLAELAGRIEDNPGASTRFAVLRPAAAADARRYAHRTA